MSGYGAYIGPQNAARNGNSANERRLDAARRRYIAYSGGFPTESPGIGMDSEGMFRAQQIGDMQSEFMTNQTAEWPMMILMEEEAQVLPNAQSDASADMARRRAPRESAPMPFDQGEGYALPAPARPSRQEEPMMGSGNVQSRQALLNRVMMQDFEALELALYLDTHPTDTRALAMHRAAAERAKALREEYEARFGPLTQMGVRSDTRWTWVDNPWPWDPA
jgi:spore coat protein JB